MNPLAHEGESRHEEAFPALLRPPAPRLRRRPHVRCELLPGPLPGQQRLRRDLRRGLRSMLEDRQLLQGVPLLARGDLVRRQS
jgi:hypothetical protein